MTRTRPEPKLIRTRRTRAGWVASIDGTPVATRADRYDAEGDAVRLVQAEGALYKIVNW